MARIQRRRYANNLAHHRKRVSLRIRDVVRQLGHGGDSQYSSWASGRRLPSLRSALKLAFILKCPVEVLYFELYDEVRADITARKRRIDQLHAPPEI